MSLDGNTLRYLKAALGNSAAADELNTILNIGENKPYTASFTPAAGSANVCEVTIQIKDGSGTAVAYPVVLDVLLSDASTGTGLTATTASGAVAAKASSGTDLSTLVSKKALKVQTKADGTYILSITDTGKTAFYVVANIPGVAPVVSSVLTTANYG